MLTRGNHKLGTRRIWSFSLPSGPGGTCAGMTPACGNACYAVAFERYRPTAARAYRRNLARARRRDFVRRVRAFIIAHAVRVVRVHVAGDYFAVWYARKWLQIMHHSPRVRFYFYTRSWRVPAIKAVIDLMAELPNCRAWYSTDRDTGVPADVPPRARVAWLMTAPGDAPPPGTDLVFRVRRLRRHLEPASGPCVCPAEDGVVRTRAMTCERCGICWRPTATGRIPLPVIETGS